MESLEDFFEIFSRVLFVVLFAFVAIASAAKKLDCKVKDVSFANRPNPTATCELKYVKYIAGKNLTFNETSMNNLTYREELRVKFIDSNLQVVPIILFEQFRRLEILEMNGVGLRNIFSHAFDRAEYLKVFHAYGNKLTTLGAFSFAGATKLENLDLSANMITNVNYEAFAGLENLKELSLSSNKIAIIDEQTFHPLKNLTWIWLDRNQIKIIAVSLLVNSQKLKGIYLNDNKISALSPILVDKLPDLEFLFLRGNNCTNENFVNTMIAKNSNVKKELATCFKEFRSIVPDEEEKFRLKNVLRDAEKANGQCETDKASLLERLETTRQQLAALQPKNGK